MAETHAMSNDIDTVSWGSPARISDWRAATGV
jgi:hypothetical protein